VANTPPELSLDEKGIIVYMAGYLALKTSKKFNCQTCLSLWKRNVSDVAEDDVPNEYTFLGNKQYEYIQTGGLFSPSERLVSFVITLESVFRSHVSSALHNDKLRGKFMTQVLTSPDLTHITCGAEACSVIKMYMLQLYFIVRIKHVFREQNRSFQSVGNKRNRKALKLLHI
jgi:hypothetical protein